jgi:hypothetical protein
MEVGLRAIVPVGKDEGVKPYIQNMAKIGKRNINQTFLAILFSVTHGEGRVPKCS